MSHPPPPPLQNWHNSNASDPDRPIPTTLQHRRPTAGAGALGRSKTLTRPDRHIAPAPLISTASNSAKAAQGRVWTWWVVVSYAFTFMFPSSLLSVCGVPKLRQQAWREKVSLCAIALILGGIVGFFTVGINSVFCPDSAQNGEAGFSRVGSIPGTLSVSGWLFNVSRTTVYTGDDFTQAGSQSPVDLLALSNLLPGLDITNLFARYLRDLNRCVAVRNFAFANTPFCTSALTCPMGSIQPQDFAKAIAGAVNTTCQVGYSWEDIYATTGFMVINGQVLNMGPYLSSHPAPIKNDPIDAAIRISVIPQFFSLPGGTSKLEDGSLGNRDATRLFFSRQELKDAVPCLLQRYRAGAIDKITPGCFFSQLFLYVSLAVILGIILARFFMACIFNWFLAPRLILPPKAKDLARLAVSPAVMPDGANVSVGNDNGVAPWVQKDNKIRKKRAAESATSGGNPNSDTSISLQRIGPELYTVCLVTCYSEGRSSVKTTLDSLANTNYSDSRKLLFVVADGMVTGHGEAQSTPDICVDLIEADARFGSPQPMSYCSVGQARKAVNRAIVYAGHYNGTGGRRTPCVVVVKCGTEFEAKMDKKPGNRGKRDSQLILMSFFSHVTYNDRMTPLEYDLFRKIHVLMGVTPDFFECVLMVDADTMAYPDSLKQLINCVQHDGLIMGVCGETRIANKRQSWVTAIQVYEYFISHHLAKAFESVFGGVTCLPGCFSMFRLKARKEGEESWIPLIIKPEIVKEYSQSNVATLHQKNLLLLGEDRFLTTILLRNFPNRKMMFCPQARCRTIVPDEFSVLLSQRRRWINSTVHNLMELVRVRNLCGTFCFSMQFVVLLDLIGTVVLPVAICLTYVLIVKSILNPPNDFAEAIPLLLLLAVLGLPAFLILITTGKVIYIAWMSMYLIALPIWNCVLPAYSFWRFDDFSWGETRKVTGESKDDGHDFKEGLDASSSVPLRRWEDWERSRLRKLKREEQRRKDFQRQFDRRMGAFAGEDGGAGLSVRSRSDFGGSDTTSLIGSEEDIWGTNIGAYDENDESYPPPPQTLIPEEHRQAPTVRNSFLAKQLDEGFGDDDEFQQIHPNLQSQPRYALEDNPYTPNSHLAPRSYTPLTPPHVNFDPTREPLQNHAITSSTQYENGKGHVRRRSGENVGPASNLI